MQHMYMQIANMPSFVFRLNMPSFVFRFLLLPPRFFPLPPRPTHVRSVFFDSRFYHPSNWSSFALKNVGVLAICVATAYSVGYACRVAINAGPFGPDEGDRGLWHAE